MTEEPTEEEIDQYIMYLIETGAMELVALNAEGDPIYKFTDKCKELAPELYELAEEDFGKNVMELWQFNCVDIMWPEQDDPHVALLPAAFDDEVVSKLSDTARETLYEIIRTFDEVLKEMEDNV